MSLNLGGDGVITGCTSLAEPALTLSGLTVDTDTLVVDSANSRVGIGTSSPATRFDVRDDSTNPVQFAAGSSQTSANLRLGVGSTGNSIPVFVDNTVLESRDGGLALGTSTGDPILFYNNAGRVERMRIDSSGNVGIGQTNPAVDLDVNGEVRASTGILFGTDTAAANSLDDYEEGTWTPVFQGGTTAGSYTYGTQVGKYTKIGNKVTVTATVLNIATVSAGAGTLEISGLPFAQAGSYSSGAIYMAHFDVSDSTVNLSSRIDGASSKILVLETRDAVNASALDVTDKVNDSADIITTITYFTSS